MRFFVVGFAVCVVAACGGETRNPSVATATPTASATPSATPTATATETATATPTATANDAGAIGVPSDFSITLERTPCLGTCPVYTVTVNAKGEVFFSGWYPTKGCAKATIPVSSVATLASEVSAMGFFNLKKQYTASVTDHPWAKTTLTSSGHTKTVEHYLADRFGGGDDADRKALRDLEKDIDTLTGSPLHPLGACNGRSAYPGIPRVSE